MTVKILAISLFFAAITNLGAASCNATSSVTQERFDIARSGITANETNLTQANVSSSFHLQTTFQTSDNIWAQPLLCDTGSIRILVVADASGNVYGFNADATGTPAAIWTSSLGTPVSGGGCNGDFDPNANCGLVATPVIDPSTAVVYLEFANSAGTHQLFALNVADGTTFHSPVTINATDTASGIQFATNASLARERSGLQLLNGTLYLSYASAGDADQWYGWVIGFNSATLQQTVQFCNTCSLPGSGGGGLWGTLTSDGTDLFVTAGNGFVTDLSQNFNPGVEHLSGTNLAEVDWFAPYNYASLTQADTDIDSNVVLFPPSNPSYIIFGGKEGRVMVLNKATGQMGFLEGGTGNPPVFQSWLGGNIHDLYRGDLLATSSNLYVGGSHDPVQVFGWNGSAFTGIPEDGFPGQLQGLAATSMNFGFSGAQLAYSWDGSTSGSEVLWAVGTLDRSGGYSPEPGHLCAFHPTTLQTLYCSDNTAGDALGNAPKLTSMAIANGRVYVPTRSSAVQAYGLITDVSSQVKVTTSGLVYSRATNSYSGTLKITNVGSTSIAAPIQSVFVSLLSAANLTNATGIVPSGPYAGSPYITVPGNALLAPGASVTIPLKFTETGSAAISYVSKTLSGAF